MDNDDNEVGYRKPPMHTRFSSEYQPKRRKRGKQALGVKSELEKLLSKKAGYRLNGVPTEDYPLRVILRILRSQAMNGQGKRPLEFLNFTQQVLGTGDIGEVQQPLSDMEAALLEAFLARVIADRDAEPNGGSATPGDHIDDNDNPEPEPHDER